VVSPRGLPSSRADHIATSFSTGLWKTIVLGKALAGLRPSPLRRSVVVLRSSACVDEREAAGYARRLAVCCALARSHKSI